jgi:hypothetical protein
VPDQKESQMTEQIQPGMAPASKLPVESGEQGNLRLVLELLLAERQDALAEKKARAEAYAEKEKHRKLNAEYITAEKLRSQKLCTHKKGGKGLRGPKVDYAVGFHTFVDGSSYIRCLICGAKWKNTDTKEYLVRRGVKVPNHTGLGWIEAYQMLGESSNTATSSEVMLNTSPVQPKVTDFVADPRAVEV